MPPTERLSAAFVKEAISEQKQIKIPCELIETNPDQPRQYFDPSKLLALKRNIEANGQRRPADVKVMPGSGPYQFKLVTGERRYRVCSELGRPLLAVIKSYPNADAELDEMTIENVNRVDLTVMETARLLEKHLQTKAIKKLSTRADQLVAIGEKCSMSGFWAGQMLSLLKLAPELQELLDAPTPKDSRLPLTVAYRLATLEHEHQRQAHRRAKDDGLDTKGLQRVIDGIINGDKTLSDHRRGRKIGIRVLLRMINRQDREDDDMLAIEDKVFDQMFSGRTLPECKAIARDLDVVIGKLTKVKGRVENVRIGVAKKPANGADGVAAN